MSSSDLPPDDLYRRRLYEVRGDPDLSLEEKLERMLALGREYLDVENGHVKRVDRAAGTHEVLVSVGGGDLVHEGDIHRHATTYCRRTVERDSSLAVSDVRADGWADDPAYREHGLACYLGAAIAVGGETFGTVCFVDRHPKGTPFTPSERAFVELVAAIVGTELESLRHEHELDNHEHVINVLNRVLRHNLRNGMTATAGFAEILADHLEGDQRELAERIREMSYELSGLAETARQLEGVVTAPGAVTSRDVVPPVSEVATDLRERYPDAAITTSVPAEQEVLATDHLRTALYELGENAVEHSTTSPRPGDEDAVVHGGAAPTVEFRVVPPDDPDDGHAVVAVSDDGPGLPEHERRLLRGEQEDPLDHGSGLGLLLVYWVVRQAGGEITVGVDDGTTVALRLPVVHDARRRPPWSPYALAGSGIRSADGPPGSKNP